MAKPQLVGILGPSYCGSTLINYCLGASRDVLALGEAHWLISDMTPFNVPWMQTCQVTACIEHGPECLRLRPEVLAGFRSARSEWYRDLARALGAETLVVADKHPFIHAVLGRCDAWVLPFKDSRALVWSHLRHEHLGRRKSPTERWPLIPGIIDAVCNLYAAATQFMNEGSEPFAAISLEALAGSPEAALSSLARAIGLVPDPRMAVFWEFDQCSLGGNFRIKDHYEKPAVTSPEQTSDWPARFQRRFSIDDRWRTALTAEEAERIVSDPRIESTWAALRAIEVGLV